MFGTRLEFETPRPFAFAAVWADPFVVLVLAASVVACAVQAPQRSGTDTSRGPRSGASSISAPPSLDADGASSGAAGMAGLTEPTLGPSVTPRAKPSPSDPLGARRIDPDGSDDAESVGVGTLPKQAHFEKVGRAPISLRQICDLTAHGDALYAAHALAALGADGATISRYRPSYTKRPFSVAFDWNRPGEPSKGGGAGQGFLRVRAISGRLFVPDADPPYNGFGLVDWGTEGYVFVSRPDGTFASAMRPHYRPPGRPDRQTRAGAMLLPRAYHVFDVIRFRGQLIASTGAVPPKERAWVGASPGALHVANEDWSRLEYQVAYPIPDPGGVWRLTFMVRFRDALYAGIEDYAGRSPHDYVVLAPPPGVSAFAQEQLTPIRATEYGAAQTVRWYADQYQLYWIALGRDGARLRVTVDGAHWRTIPLPSDAGAPTDLVRFRDSLVLLTERGLYRLEAASPQALTSRLSSEPGATDAPEHWQVTAVARISDKQSPFELRDILCAAPLAVFENELYAGGQRDGSLYRLVADGA